MRALFFMMLAPAGLAFQAGDVVVVHYAAEYVYDYGDGTGRRPALMTALRRAARRTAC